MGSAADPKAKHFKNAMTVDVEDYFHVAAFEKCIKRKDWDSMPLRVESNTRRILDLFDSHDIRATFFVLGWVAERAPSLVKEIQNRGHEIASHGYGHRRITTGTKESFRADVRHSKELLEDITGEPVHGYRAPTYSVTERTLWALDILVEEGFSFDSSIFPIHHDLYGMPGFGRFPQVVKTGAGDIMEFPITTAKVRIGWKLCNAPVAGGGYLRLFPASWILKKLKSVNEEDGQPVLVYFHPWEIDPDQPRIKAPLKSRFRHYVNIEKTHSKIERLLGSFEFAPMGEVLRETLQ